MRRKAFKAAWKARHVEGHKVYEIQQALPTYKSFLTLIGKKALNLTGRMQKPAAVALQAGAKMEEACDYRVRDRWAQAPALGLPGLLENERLVYLDAGGSQAVVRVDVGIPKVGHGSVGALIEECGGVEALINTEEIKRLTRGTEADHVHRCEDVVVKMVEKEGGGPYTSVPIAQVWPVVGVAQVVHLLELSVIKKQ
jgi:hypothetical protein